MSVNIIERKFYNEFRPETPTNLIGNIGEKMRCETVVAVFKDFILGDNTVITFNPTLPVVHTDYIVCNENIFAPFQVGEVLNFDGFAPLTIVQKISNNTIKVTPAVTANGTNYQYPSSSFYATSALKDLEYQATLIENSSADSFASLTDGNICRWLAKNIDTLGATDYTTTVPFVGQGQKSWQDGAITIQRVDPATQGDNPIYYKFYRIKHTFKVIPFMQAGDFDNIVLGVPPAYFENSKCLKYIQKAKAFFAQNYPNNNQENIPASQDGNTGWFGENFNTGLTNYSISGLVIKDNLGNVIPSIKLTTEETNIEFLVNNTADSPFLAGINSFTINFCKAPNIESQYKNNGQLLDQNFLFDRKNAPIAGGTFNGEQFGTARQVLKDIVSTPQSATQTKITCKIAFSPEIVEEYASLETKQYMLWWTTGDNTNVNDDRVALMVDVNNIFVNNFDPDLVNDTLLFLRHPDDNRDTEGLDTLDAFPEDEIVATHQLYIDKSGLEPTDTVKIIKAEFKMIAKNTVTFEEFVLSKYTFNFNALPFIGGNQYVDFVTNRPYHIPETEIRRQIRIKRRTDLDSAGKYYYDFNFPLLFRWEYWVALTGVDADFFDVGEPNNGFNNFWQRYNTVGDWRIFYDMVLTVDKNGTPSEYHSGIELGANDYDTNPDYTPNSIKSFIGATEQTDGVNKFIYGYKDVAIKARFTYVPGSPIVGNYAAVFGIEVFESGGETGRRRISTEWATDGDTWFKSITGNGKADKAVSGNDIIISCLIDSTKIPLTNQKYKITCRLYDLTIGVLAAKITEIGEFKITEDGTLKIIE